MGLNKLFKKEYGVGLFKYSRDGKDLFIGIAANSWLIRLQKDKLIIYYHTIELFKYSKAKPDKKNLNYSRTENRKKEKIYSNNEVD